MPEGGMAWVGVVSQADGDIHVESYIDYSGDRI